jgi:hypothetical protein
LGKSARILYNHSAEREDRTPPIILQNWEEVIGTLDYIVPDTGHSKAKIGDISVWLPEDLCAELLPLVGQRVGVLKTDTSRQYRVRVVMR